jgi:hypothetical protein
MIAGYVLFSHTFFRDIFFLSSYLLFTVQLSIYCFLSYILWCSKRNLIVVLCVCSACLWKDRKKNISSKIFICLAVFFICIYRMILAETFVVVIFVVCWISCLSDNKIHAHMKISGIKIFILFEKIETIENLVSFFQWNDIWLAKFILFLRIFILPQNICFFFFLLYQGFYCQNSVSFQNKKFDCVLLFLFTS